MARLTYVHHEIHMCSYQVVSDTWDSETSLRQSCSEYTGKLRRAEVRFSRCHCSNFGIATPRFCGEETFVWAFMIFRFKADLDFSRFTRLNSGWCRHLHSPVKFLFLDVILPVTSYHLCVLCNTSLATLPVK